MTTEPTKEALFKQRFVSVLADFKQNGIKDSEAMELIGSLAASLADSLEQKSWTGAKQAMTAAAYDALLDSFQTRGNKAHQNGQTKQAYALQLLGVSLVAMTQRSDADLMTGEKLLDQMIDSAVAHYRRTRARH
ncbi:hypothetical protein NIM87_09315 [Devosia sp. XJ19-1]|uniref:Uncharacterized protein n=1 Tax=Devosia ureilytica TaxID=2952754 RepID=A0A9Q4FSL6_9HYPH|nr:hypothetical protein [Devosia ureilytica]MCP8883695.1 hypothetical protein [Devosia ureilytica]MCP8887303.1 hypothetical protein [Devosia ureilytica]